MLQIFFCLHSLQDAKMPLVNFFLDTRYLRASSVSARSYPQEPCLSGELAVERVWHLRGSKR